MTYVFPPALPVSLPIFGRTERFPVRRVYCVGQNYSDHIAEMGGNLREPPFFFSKPSDALAPGDGEVVYPPQTEDYQHEIELVVAIGEGGCEIAAERALAHVFGYAVGLDMTRRDLQRQAKERQQPWEMCKGADQSAPISPLFPVAQAGHPCRGAIWLKVNSVEKQRGDLAQMIWNPAEIIANLSAYVALAPGDLIFTGTPAGVSAVTRGDVLEGGVDGLGNLNVRVV